jgi:hypothetical protein
MPNIESTLKQFLLLSSIAFLGAQPSYALVNPSSEQIVASADTGAFVMAPKATPHTAIRRHRAPSTQKRFTNNFQLPYLPAISE